MEEYHLEMPENWVLVNTENISGVEGGMKPWRMALLIYLSAELNLDRKVPAPKHRISRFQATFQKLSGLYFDCKISTDSENLL